MTRTTEFVRRITTPDPAVLAQVRDPDEITARILSAALDQFETVGVRRSTMDDVARRGGLARATLYRRFPNKAMLVDAVVLNEVNRYLDGNAIARSHGATFEERLVNGTVFTIGFLREHALLKKLMRAEPETILPSLTVDADAIVELATEQSAALLAAELYGAVKPTAAQQRHLRIAGELQTRLVLSFILTPHTSINFADTHDVRAWVQDYLLPMITGPTGTSPRDTDRPDGRRRRP